MSEIWMTSDTHFGHSNIVRGTTNWATQQACRDFNTLEEHNTTIIDNINKNVKEDDILYHLGDWSFGGKENVEKFRKLINCKNVHLIYGNHDHHIKKSSEYRALFLSCNDILYKTIGKDNFVFCHYSMRTWDRAHHGSIMLYGHSHGTLPEYSTKVVVGNEHFNISFETDKYFKTMDVGIDTHPEFRPYHLDEIREIMYHRIPLHVDHHSKDTN